MPPKWLIIGGRQNKGGELKFNLSPDKEAILMANEFTAVVERDGEWFIAYCPEVPGANGQGKTKEEAIESLSQAIALILQDRREDGLKGVPPDAVLDKVAVK